MTVAVTAMIMGVAMVMTAAVLPLFKLPEEALLEKAAMTVAVTTAVMFVVRLSAA